MKLHQLGGRQPLSTGFSIFVGVAAEQFIFSSSEKRKRI
jgi:hypothetical protein